ncbi:flagellin/flagellar hook associated protein [Rhodobacteraceae bacterium HIMB11]|nr:flagellin/flagellar hook associated protein [Rhodobacteraceae bacterium HIMB11]
MTVINTNTAAINAQYNLSKVQSAMDDAMSALSSGKRINSAADDAAGIAISSRMEAQVRGLNQAMRNAADGQSLVDTAEGAMDEISNMLQRMRELAIQSANDTNSDSDRDALNLEIDALIAEIDRVVDTTAWNGKNILDGSAQLNFQIGSQAGQDLNVAISSLGSNALGSLTGAPSSDAVLSSAHQGVAAETTEVKIAFNGNDTYSFNLNITDSAGNAQALAIQADVTNSSAVNVAGAINQAIQNANLDEYASASASGNVVTVKNTFGEAITLDTFASVGTGSGTYTTVNGGAGSASVVNLGSAAGNTGTTFNVNVPATSYAAEVSATTGTAAQFKETLTATDFADVTAWVANTDFGSNPGAADHLEVDFGDFSVTIDNADATDLASFAAAINSEQSAYTFSAVIEDAGGGNLSYSLKAVANNVGAVANADIPTIKAIDANGAVIQDGAFGGGLAMTASVAGVDATSGSAETGGTKLNLELFGADDYSFTLDTVAISFSYHGTSASRDQIAQEMQVALNAGTADTYEVVNANGRLEITNQSNSAAALSAFTSTGSGTILASTLIGDAGAEGPTQVLDDTVHAVAASTTAAGTATATVVDLEFTADDVYSFKISDGERTAIVDATSVDAQTPDVTEMIAAINYGLTRAGMDDSVTVSNTGGVIHLTQSAGREVSVSDFRSDGTGSMLASGGANTNGVSKYLDDGLGAGASTVSQISIATSSGAQDAIEILDRALQDVAMERAELGAVSNRLDHTISNLGNIVVNTEASQSRIEDADFASETSNLTKAQILSQAATAMLAQANASKQSVLSLLQG